MDWHVPGSWSSWDAKPANSVGRLTGLPGAGRRISQGAGSAPAVETARHCRSPVAAGIQWELSSLQDRTTLLIMCQLARESRHARSQALTRRVDVDRALLADTIEIEQLLARYAIGMTKDDIDAVIDVFTPDGTYSAFGATYTLKDFPTLARAAPKGLFLTGTPVVELDGDQGTGQQTLCFIDQTTHDMRIGWYSDTYRRTAHGWRLHTRAMTFLRRSGARDAGKSHDPTRPLPSTQLDG
jgi:SnoaL-like domain